ncbi:hypothetical protein QBZ16_001156 [Prototheca wickerhamii]|uniref:Beclin 1 n=1 Tax=Prototheca wickerhamii TaxID=3111 RepID=A0AAD9IFL8_PROWI|nr:hypothetical protein QBZ16_001156 [Prototheca wickerhamii]
MEPQVYQCQQCKCRIVISASEMDPPSPGPSGQPSRLEESFMVLEDTLYRDRSATGDHAAARRMEESFVMLHAPRSVPGGPPSAGATSALHASPSAATARVPFYATLRALTNVLDVASQASAVDHPVCAECAADIRRELDAQTADLQAELAAYDAALARLEDARGADEGPAASEAAAAIAAAEAELAARRAELAAAEAEAAAVEAEVAALEGAAADLAACEAAYWHEHNAYKRRLAAHVAERDATAAQLEHGAVCLAALRRANVLNDAFRIWFSGPFGTINRLRLGRTAAHPVPWPEVNAAWGAAVTLLAVLVRQSGAQLRAATLLPCGSFPCVADERGTHELFGPVSKLLCPAYDRAQICFLACLKEYSEWLAQSVRGPGFHLPWAIEGDRVGSLSIRFMLAKDKNWTKALEYMLVDLKFCLKATIALNSSGGGAGDEGAEGGARATLGRGQRVGPLGRLDAAAAGQ